jgi:glycosyltransferase involved in cell wall biosynthesis
VHHVRNFESSNTYLSDSHREANSSLYGAQELDTWAGIRLLQNYGAVERYEICPNLGFSRSIDAQGNLNSECYFYEGSKLFLKRPNLTAMKLLRNGFDPSVARWDLESLKKHFCNIVSNGNYDVIWADTQFYEPLLKMVGVPTIVRSVNFEPRHVLGEDGSWTRYLKAVTKLYTEIVVSRDRTFISISPRDQISYNRVRISSELIPLRQLCYLIDVEHSIIENRDTVYFTGSTYDVLHNRKNLLFIVNQIAPRLMKVNPNLRIVVTGNRIPSGILLPENVEYLGFLPDLQERLRGALAVIVPYFGGAGMQSKLFEAFTVGASVIANPDALSGYPFVPTHDFLPAVSAEDFVNSILRVHNDPIFAQKIAVNSAEKAKFLFSRRNIDSRLRNILHNALNSH